MLIEETVKAVKKVMDAARARATVLLMLDKQTRNLKHCIDAWRKSARSSSRLMAVAGALYGARLSCLLFEDVALRHNAPTPARSTLSRTRRGSLRYLDDSITSPTVPTSPAGRLGPAWAASPKFMSSVNSRNSRWGSSIVLPSPMPSSARGGGRPVTPSMRIMRRNR